MGRGNKSLAGWQVSKMHLGELSFFTFTGEYIDLGVMSTLSGWDTKAKWSDVSALSPLSLPLSSPLSSPLNNDQWKEPKLDESSKSDNILAFRVLSFPCLYLLN